MRRASHALAHDGRAWLVDPVDGPGLDDALAGLGPVAGVVCLLGRHRRDAGALAARHGAALHMVPAGGVPGAPFHAATLMRRPWREVALWWPERRLLAVAEAVGTAPYFREPGARVGVHPLLRAAPPRPLLRVAPRVLLCGHGAPLHAGDVAADLHAAIRGARRGIPRWLRGLPAALRAPDRPDPGGP